jgi:Fur family transcriptional regulator, ferric uptake regulator
MGKPALRTSRPNGIIICERCGRIVEFIQPQIEQLQEAVAQRFGFVATNHKMEIYGICQECREGKSARTEQGQPAPYV